MSTISGVSGSSGNDPWAAMKAQRSQMQAKMFAKVDTDSSGGVDATELQTVMTDISKKTGTAVSSEETAALFKQMDSNADGSLSSDEMAKGMQAMMQPPTSTMDFAQSRGMGGEGGSGGSQDDLFAKVDSNGDGSISKTEMQAMMDKIGKKNASGATSSTSSSEKFAKLDTNGDGSVSKAEFEAGRTAHKAAGGHHPHEGGGPPPTGGGGGGGVSSSSSATTYDPLDTNQDGTVSLAERLAGGTKTDPLQTLFKAMDSDSDGKISSSESNAFAKQLSDQLSQNSSSTATSSSSTTGDSTSASNDRFDLSKLARMLYDQMASGIAQTSQSTSLSAMA